MKNILWTLSGIILFLGISCRSHLEYANLEKKGDAGITGSRVFIFPEMDAKPDATRPEFSASFLQVIRESLLSSGYTLVQPLSIQSTDTVRKSEDLNEFQWFFKSGSYLKEKNQYTMEWDKVDLFLQSRILEYKRGFSLASDYLSVVLEIYSVDGKQLIRTIRVEGFYEDIERKIQISKILPPAQTAP